MRLFFLLSATLFACSNDPALVKEFIASKDLPIEEIEDAELLHTSNGNLKVKIVASKIERFQSKEPYLTFSNHIEVYFFNDSVQLQSTLSAENAEIDKKTRKMTAFNNVILKSADSKKLETEELIWDELENKIYTDKKVKITTGKEIVEGHGFISNADFTEYTISKIHGIFSFENKTE